MPHVFSSPVLALLCRYRVTVKRHTNPSYKQLKINDYSSNYKFTMKTKLFIIAMLLMPMMFGCSKDNNVDQRLVGDWFLFYYEQTNNDYIDPSYNDSFSETYTQETTEVFYTFDDNGKCSCYDRKGVVESSGSWSTGGGKLTIRENGMTISYDIVFDGDDQFYMIFRVEYDEGGSITTNPDEACGETITKVGLKRI